MDTQDVVETLAEIGGKLDRIIKLLEEIKNK